MKCFNFFSAIILFSLITLQAIAQESEEYQFISPIPGSELNSRESTIIIRDGGFINPTSLETPNLIRVVGDKSGLVSGELILSTEGKTVIFKPFAKFQPDETVHVTLTQGIRTITDKVLPRLQFSFKVTSLVERPKLHEYLTDEYQIANSQNYPLEPDTLPANFPTITVDTSNNPSDGKLFLANLSGTFNTGNYLMILNNDGSVVKYKEVDGLFGISFTVLPNGELSYGQIIAVSPGVPVGRFIVMDTTLAPVDTFQCGNGYITHPSDFILLPNGHAILHATDPQPIDMSPYGGDPNAIVVGNVIQELDESKNVVFQWRSWDYLPISDSYVNLTTPRVDLTHANALALDANGNILYSIRHTSSIPSISRQTGNVNWILGGKRDQFTYINENFTE